MPPAVPLAVVALVTTGAGIERVSVRLAVPVPLLFVALSPTDEVPDAVGVPEIKPVAAFTDRPAGSPAAA